MDINSRPPRTISEGIKRTAHSETYGKAKEDMLLAMRHLERAIVRNISGTIAEEIAEAIIALRVLEEHAGKITIANLMKQKLGVVEVPNEIKDDREWE